MNYAELIAEAEAELTALENKQKLVQFQKRIRFLRLLKTGAAKTQAAAGEMVGWKLRQAQKIWQLYRTGGVEEALRRNQNWHQGKLSAVERTQLSEHLSVSNGAMSLAAIRHHIQSTFGVDYTIGGISDLCGRLKIKLKTARPANVLKDEEQAGEYKKTLAS
jgi:transposase